MVVRNVVKATGEERWLLNKATAVVGPEGEILMAVNLIEDITETKRHEIAQRLMAETLRTLAETPDLTSTLQAIADAAVPSLADWASVNMVEESGAIKTLAIAHRDPEKVRQGWYLNQRWPDDHDESRGLGSVIRTGEPLLVHEITEEMLAAPRPGPRAPGDPARGRPQLGHDRSHPQRRAHPRRAQLHLVHVAAL